MLSKERMRQIEALALRKKARKEKSTHENASSPNEQDKPNS